MREEIWWIIGALLYMGLLYALVRPNSQGPQLVTNIFNALSDLIRGSAGYTWDSSSNAWKAPS